MINCYNNKSTESNNISKLLAEAVCADKDSKYFGSGKHTYKLNPCISEKIVKEFENKYGITLSEDFRRFFIEIGTGSVGPYYGIYALDVNSLLIQQKKIGRK